MWKSLDVVGKIVVLMIGYGIYFLLFAAGLYLIKPILDEGALEIITMMVLFIVPIVLVGFVLVENGDV